MRTLPLLICLALAGCETSKHANDPRAKGTEQSIYQIGQFKLNYLDYIDQYPRDKDTERYLPVITLNGEPIPDAEKGLPIAGAGVPPEIERLLSPGPGFAQ
jgi:hypothetical protein